MAATQKADLLSTTEKEFIKLEKLLAPLGDTETLIRHEDDTSIKDIVGHRAHWIELFLGWYFDGQAGKKVYFPAEGYKWNELKSFNARLREKQQTLDWHQAHVLLQSNHARLVDFINNHSNEELYGGPMKGANNKWTPGRWAEAAGPSHYRSAAKYIRKCLKSGA